MLSRFCVDLLSYSQDSPSSALEIRFYAFSYCDRDPSNYYIGPPCIPDALPSVQFSKAPSLLKLADRLLSDFRGHPAPRAPQCDPMDSVGSSSNVQTVEEHLADIQQSLDALKLKTDVQEVKGLNQWKAFANELSTLKKDLKDSKGELNYYKDVVFTEFKDAANTTGNFSNRITALESVVKKILEKFN